MGDLALARYQEWLNSPYFDNETIEELRAIKDGEEIEDRFYKDLEFGTAGLRGLMGAGTNRMNKYTVRRATQGLATYLKSLGSEALQRGVVIAYDCRWMSREFAHEAALVLGANGIRAYVFPDLRPTPELSFAVLFLNCVAGIMITASHNPAQFNGYKVYSEDGAQITSSLAEDIIREIKKVHDWGSIPVMEQEMAVRKGLFVYLDDEIEQAYFKEVKKQSLRGDIVKSLADDFKIVFTPLHGTGNLPVRRILREVGFRQVYVVPEQELPDGSFPTVISPNPEEREAYYLALELAGKKDAELIIGTDPDCDRVGAVVKDKRGEYVVLTGNQIGALLVNYILEGLWKKGQLPSNGVIIKTIVTSELGAAIAQDYGVETLNVLTGFKYIGEKIKEFEDTKKRTFIFGYEESYGYLAGTYARDKDGVVASMLIAEMVAYYVSEGKSIPEALEELYQKYGFYLEDLKSLTLTGREGLEKIKRIMDYFRKESLTSLAGKRLLAKEDYLLEWARFQLPPANVLKFHLEGEAWVCLRPSGTEPKLKAYVGVKGTSLMEAEKILAGILEEIMEIIQGID